MTVDYSRVVADLKVWYEDHFVGDMGGGMAMPESEFDRIVGQHTTSESEPYFPKPDPKPNPPYPPTPPGPFGPYPPLASRAAEVAAAKEVLEWVYERYGLADVQYAEPPDIEADAADFVAAKHAEKGEVK